MQRIIATIGAPRSGKSTFANRFDPCNWVVCTFDDFRQTLWPPHRRKYWEVRKSDNGPNAQKLLHHVKYAAVSGALEYGFSVLSPDTHVKPGDAAPLKEVAKRFGIEIEWKVLAVPYNILVERNNSSDETLGHKVPDDILLNRYNLVWAKDAWWRKEPNVRVLLTSGTGQSAEYDKTETNLPQPVRLVDLYESLTFARFFSITDSATQELLGHCYSDDPNENRWVNGRHVKPELYEEIYVVNKVEMQPLYTFKFSRELK